MATDFSVPQRGLVGASLRNVCADCSLATPLVRENCRIKTVNSSDVRLEHQGCCMLLEEANLNDSQSP